MGGIVKKFFLKLIFFTILISLFPVFVLADDEILEELIPINTMSEEVSYQILLYKF